jgi:hypothetical protein
MIIGNPNNIVKDRHPLWKNFRNNNFERPFMHGVVGPQWQVPLSEDDKGFKHIASPMPKPQITRRILADDLPPVTYSPTSFDMPMRKDVIQVDIPNAVIKTTEENIDPRFPPKKPVQKVTGTLYHGTGSTDERVVHGLSFLQKKSKKNHKRNIKKETKSRTVKYSPKLLNRLKKEGIDLARQADSRVTKSLYDIVNDPAENHLILGVDLINRYETPDLKIHENNAHLQERLKRIRNTPAGVRSAHTLRKLP